MKPPTAFIPSHSAPFSAPLPEPTRARVVDTVPAFVPPRPVLPRAVPTLTVYADGLVNLNGDAERALGKAEAVTLAAPAAPGGQWLLLPVPAQHPGALRLYSASQGGGMRFRAVALATAVFAVLAEQERKKPFRLVPTGDAYRLVAD